MFSGILLWKRFKWKQTKNKKQVKEMNANYNCRHLSYDTTTEDLLYVKIDHSAYFDKLFPV